MTSSVMNRCRKNGSSLTVKMGDFDSLLNQFGPFFQRSVGFDRMFNTMSHALENVNGNASYPPYSIVQTGENDYAIEMAVVGFSRDEIGIELNNGLLTIKGAKRAERTVGGEGEAPATEPSFKTRFIHKGIANRDFSHAFRLEDHILVGGASLEDGLLKITLKRELPEALKPRQIDIN